MLAAARPALSCCLLIGWFVVGLAGSARGQLLPDGFAAMGASETAGTTYSGSWVPYLARDRGWNFGGTNEPYNVAVGGATSVTLLSQNQHTQVRNLVQSGQVDAAFFMIGANDFNAQATRIASGALSGAELATFINGVVANSATALDTVLAAEPTGVVVIGLPELMLTPGGRLIFDTPAEIARGRTAIDLTNSAIQAMAAARHLPVIDIARAQRDFEALPSLQVGGVAINLAVANSNPHYFFQDQIHPGAVGNGIIANAFMAGMNFAYGTAAAPLSDLEILTRAGLGAEYTGETTALDYLAYVIYPEPSNVALASLSTNSVLRLDPAAQVSTLADAGDGLLTPLDTRYDGQGNVFVADVLRSRVLRVAPDGQSTVFADLADGLASPSGLAFDNAGNLLVTNYLTNTLYRVAPNGQATLVADAADGLSSPFGVTVDSQGQIYVADLGHNNVLKIDTAGQISVFADSSDGLLTPIDVEIGPDGKVYVADVLTSTVRRFTTDGVGSVWADLGDGLTTPSGLAFDDRGNLLVSNYLSNTIVQINPSGRSELLADAADGVQAPFGLDTLSVGFTPSAVLAGGGVASVPEPSSLGLATAGAAAWAAIGILGRRRFPSSRFAKRR